MNDHRRLLFKVASHLHCSVAQIENNMSFNELQEWAEYLRDKPSMVDRVEVQLAVLSALTYNMNAKDKLSYSDFMISLSEDDRRLIKQRELESKIKSFSKGL